jgi:hypothetical protein
MREINSRRVRWDGHIAFMGDIGYAHKILIGEPEGKRPFDRHRRRYENSRSIKINFKYIGFEDAYWNHMAQDRVQRRALVNTTIKIQGFENRQGISCLE